MRMIATVRIESDDGTVAEESTNTVGVDTRVKGIDPDAAKEDFLAQARGLLTSIGETHVPAMFATVQEKVDTAKQEPEAPAEVPAESPAIAQVRGRLQQLRDRKAAGETAEQPAEPQTATDELKEKA